jgi:hypothetical protein
LGHSVAGNGRPYNTHSFVTPEERFAESVALTTCKRRVSRFKFLGRHHAARRSSWLSSPDAGQETGSHRRIEPELLVIELGA